MDELPPIRPFFSRLSAVAVTCGLVAGFVAIRGMIYALFRVDNEVDWFVRDSLMDIPRVLFAFFAWRYGRRLWKPAQLGMHWNQLRDCLVVGIALSGVILARPFFLPTTHPTFGWLCVITFSSFVVGFFEEILFRGVLLRALYDQYGAGTALWGSAFVFVLFHVQAQPLAVWPGIFLTGLIFAQMRLQGVSLWGLAFVHSVYDTLVFVFEARDEFPPLWRLSVLLILLYLFGMYTMAYRIKLLKAGEF
jgi:membrane protease YdiL (CAAX protease family)